jgi:D-alanyl-D-alanine carboxypeptidase
MPSDSELIARHEERIRQTLRELGIPLSHATGRRPSFHLECEDLVSIGLDQAGREQRLERQAAAQWQAMRDTAGREGVVLDVISAFRSFDYQRQIIARKLAAGQLIGQILRVSALPGFSEHHTGRALDIGTPGCPPLTEAFEQTAAYRWLTQHAPSFGFRLSYPRGNPHGVSFEPWHWVFSEQSASQSPA